MANKQKLDYLMGNCQHSTDLFINGRQNQLIIEPLTVFEPQNINELNDIYKYCKQKNMEFKLIKGSKYQFVNPGYNDDFFVIDVNSLDIIIGFKNGSVKHLPGVTASQLNHYLKYINSGYQVPVSMELIDPLLMYNRQCSNAHDNSLTSEYRLTEHQEDSRCLIIGLDSIEALYNLHHEIMLLKAELGSLALSFFYANQDAFLASQNRLPKTRILNSTDFLEDSTFKKHAWFLFIEIPYNKHIILTVENMVSERLGGFVYWKNSFLKCLKMSFSKDSFGSDLFTKEDNNMEYCKTISIMINNDINLLLFAYHAIYRANLTSNFKPHIFVDIQSNEQIKLSFKIYYCKAERRQEVLNYALNVINRIKLKI